ncbi:MAG: hypothetical protein OXJ37_00035 [Bryobacterales bacterium]|nr:hypothetical protein [Bryobacterales bacterium]
MRSMRRGQLARCVVALLVAYVAGTIPAAGGDFYIGASASADRLNVLYEKVVDNSNPQNTSLNQGLRVRDEASAAKLGYSYGFLAGYKAPLSITGIYVALEAEMLRHGGIAAGRLAGTGTSETRNQLGEVWAEDWTFQNDRTFGLTGRLGFGIPLIGTWFGPSVYGLVGMRRLSADFRSTYTGCLDVTPCTEPDQFGSGSDDFSESFSGLTFGGGIEQKVGAFSLRGEVRFTDYSKGGRVIPFDDVFVSVPLDLTPDSVSIGAILVWYF